MRRRWPVVVVFITALVFAGGSVQYSNYVDTTSNQRWCQLLNVLDGAYRAAPPQTKTGQIVAEEIHRLRLDFEC